MTQTLQEQAPPLRLRTGTPDELTTLLDIDNDAGALFVQAGLDLDLPDTHEFHTAERGRWSASLAAGGTFVATLRDEPIGFVALGRRDDEPFVEQLSVRCAFMRAGVGGALLAAAEVSVHAHGARRLWLSTYSHLPFNRPWYERRGFALVPTQSCGNEVLQTLEFERRWLPLPHERVVLCKHVTPHG